MSSTLKSTHKCPLCPKHYTRHHGLSNHIGIHDNNERYFKCLQCKKEFSYSKDLKNHLAIHLPEESQRALKKYGQNKFRCIFCEKRFSNMRKIYQHLRSHIGERPYWCDVCKKDVSSNRHVSRCKRHFRRPHPVKSVKTRVCCPLCNKTVPKSGLNGHVSIYHLKEKWHKCSISQCEEHFGTIHQLRKHKLTHGIPRLPRVECYFCAKSYKINNHLFKHMRARHLLEIYECKRCGKHLKNSKALDGHIRQLHGKLAKPIDPEAFRCIQCRKPYQTKSGLDQHLNVHHSSSFGFPCPLCHKILVSNSGLNLHLETHQDVKERKTLKCPHCDKLLVKRALTNHIRFSHSTPEQEVKCDICQKFFNNIRFLKQHVKRHSIVKNFKCYFCQRDFTIAGYLIEHIRIHTDETPYICGVCQRGFKTSGKRSRHMKVHDDNYVRIWCNFDNCGASYKDKGALETHVKLKHANF